MCLRATTGSVADLRSGCGELQADQGRSGSSADAGGEIRAVGGEEGFRRGRWQEREERQEGES